MKQDIEQQLFDYPFLDGRIKVLQNQINKLRENMDTRTEVLLDDRFLSKESKQSLVDSLQQSEQLLLKMASTVTELDLQKSIVESGLCILTNTERHIIAGYYFDGLPIETLRQELGYSYSWTHKLKAKAVSKLIDVLEINHD